MSFFDFVLFFFIYSFLGWVLETAYASIKKGKFINRGFLRGALCPIYGYSAVLIIQSSKWVTNVLGNHFASLLLKILLSIMLVTVLEYITGLLLEKIFHCKWWDYSDNALNLNGYICMKYSLFWGLLAFLLIQHVHPVISNVVLAIPINAKVPLTVFLLIYLLSDTINSVLETMDLRNVILGHSNISANIYYKKIIQYKRLFLAFPELLILNAGIINCDIRSILNDRMDKIKVTLKSRFQ